MTQQPASTRLDRLDARSARFLDTLAARPRLAAAVLAALALFTYLPGALMLPPVDRTEVVYAQMARGMLEDGRLFDARFEEERFAFRPIGITWLQAGTAALLGHRAEGAIASYRLASVIAAVLAVLALWRLLIPLTGARRAIIAAGLFAVTPIVALQAGLAIPEGPLLLTIVLAQLSLLRIYCAPAGERTFGLALIFWASLGASVLLNALAVPILSLSTVIALFVFDRNLSWLKRLSPLIGVPLFLLIASPWILVRAHLDGVPFSSLTFGETLRALGGAQDMKWKAAPLTFTLGLVLGFLPGAIFLVPALREIWTQRSAALQRFLLCWIAGYLAYLELISSKPALYTVQAMFPALAAAVALAIDRGAAAPSQLAPGQIAPSPGGNGLVVPAYPLRMPWWLVLPATMALFASGLTYAGVAPDFIVLMGAALIAALFTWSARAVSEGRAAAWVVTGIAGFALFIAYVFGVALPRIAPAWPAERIAEAVAPLRSCIPGPVAVLGFREPSTAFLLGSRGDSDPAGIAQRMADGIPGVAVIEDRWHDDFAQALAQRSAPMPERAGCVSAFNVMRGCKLSFSIYVSGGEQALAPGCEVEPRFACQKPVATPKDAQSSRCR
jgi:4-amino-4-deoxy-L-arabinose transferase-like glycosyltransferase